MISFSVYVYIFLQGALLEQDLGVTRPAFKRNLVRSMQWKLWGMGEEPAAPSGLRAANASSSCGAVSLEWDQTTPANSGLSFPVHKYVLRRAPMGQGGERHGDWVTVMASPHSAFFDAGLQPGATYRYALQAWNALGHSGSVEIDVVVATEDCALGGSWFWSPGGGAAGGADSAEATLGGLILATAVSVAAAFCFRALCGGGGDGNGERSKKAAAGARSWSSPGGFDRGSSGGSSISSNSGSGRREADRRRPPDSHAVVTGTVAGKAAAAPDKGGAVGNGRKVGSPVPGQSSGSGGWSDRDSREKVEPLRRLSGSATGGGKASCPTSSSSRLAASKDRLKRASSDVAAAGSNANSGGTGRLSSSARNLTVGESVRKERAKRLHMVSSRHSSSRDERGVCKECHKEWKW